MEKKKRKNFILSDLIKVLKYNAVDIVLFEFIFKLVSMFIMSPIIYGIINIIMKITNYKYLSLENIIDFAKNPVAIILLLIVILLMTFYTLFDISTLIILIDASIAGKDITIRDVLIVSLKKSLKLLLHGNVIITILVLFIIPFLNIGISTNFVERIAIPEFIHDYIFSNFFYGFLYVVLFIVLAFFLFSSFYVFHYFIIEDLPFYESLKRSFKISKREKDFVTILFTQVLFFLVYALFVGLNILIIYGLNHILSGHNIIFSFLASIVWIFLAVSYACYALFSSSISYITVSSLFYNNKRNNDEEIVHLNYSEIKRENKKRSFIWAKLAFIVIVLFSATFYTHGIITGNFSLSLKFDHNVEVTAHRGASKKYPENTMLAFIKAKELGADWVELDVAETKDGEIIVTHDTNLKRITGVNKNVYEVNLKEIRKLDAGKFKGKEFAGEKIPLLEEVLDWAQDNNMKLNIEIKPTGYEKNIEEKVVDLILDYEFEDDCVVTSQVYSVLEKVKDYNSDIKTIYVMSLAYGDILSLDKADGFSIEATSVTKSLVKKIHKENKKIFVWTVNNEENISNMIDLKVDNIITDDISNCKDLIVSSNQSDIIYEYIKFINKVFE